MFRKFIDLNINTQQGASVILEVKIKVSSMIGHRDSHVTWLKAINCILTKVQKGISKYRYQQRQS